MIELQAIGHIGKDAEQKTIGGKSYASFSIGVTEKTSDGKDKTTWLRVMKYDSEGKLTAYLTKGKKIWVRGNPYFSTYVSKNTGEAIPDTTIWADKLVFCSSGEKQNQQTERQSGPNDYSSETEDDNDLPF